MKRIIKKKLHTDSGFTLAETLLAILILLMVSAIVVTGIPAARNAYEKVVLASNAEVVMSTTISALRNELGTAKDVKVSGNEIVYYNSARESTSKIYLKGSDIKIYRYFSDEGYSKGTPDEYLTYFEDTKNGNSKNWHVKYSGVGYNSGVITFTNLSVSWKSTEITKIDTFSIRVIGKEKDSE